MEQTIKKHLKENGTLISMNAEEILNLSLNDLCELERTREENIKSGFR